MAELLSAYLAQLVEDAAYALVERHNHAHSYAACQQALGILIGGLAGTLEDPLVNAACVITGQEPPAVYQALLDQARRRAVALAAGHPKSYTPGPAKRTRLNPQAA